MSFVYTQSTDIVEREVNKLLEQDLHISGEYIKTCYLYGSDNKLIALLSKHKKDCTGSDYSINIENIGFNEVIHLQPNWRIENFYMMAKPFFDSKMSGIKPIECLTYTSQQAADFYQEFKVGKDYSQDRFINNLISNLYKSRCPIDYIEKIIYYFDKPNSKHKFQKQFDMLNHDNKLVQYKTPRGNVWFFVGEKYHMNFLPMDEQSQQIFDNVKIALKKQKQNVK